jgi:hypothetical protein
MAVDLDQHARELHRPEVTEQHTPAIHHFRIFCLGLEARQHDTAVFDFQNSGTNGLVLPQRLIGFGRRRLSPAK